MSQKKKVVTAPQRTVAVTVAVTVPAPQRYRNPNSSSTRTTTLCALADPPNGFGATPGDVRHAAGEGPPDCRRPLRCRRDEGGGGGGRLFNITFFSSDRKFFACDIWVRLQGNELI